MDAQLTAAPAGPSASIEFELVASGYGQKLAVIVGGCALPLVALVSFFACHQPWLLVWAGLILLILAGRLLLIHTFASASVASDVAIWQTRFTIGTCLLGAAWGGCAATVIVARLDPLLQLMMIATESVTVMGGAARNSGVPAAARGQVLLGVVPVICACVSIWEPVYLVLAALMLVQLITALEIARGLHERTVEALTLAAEKAGLVASLQEASARLESANRQLEIAASSDGLTGLANRRRFDAAIAIEVSRALRGPLSFSLLMFDVDKFKDYNDRFGHPAGDACLRSVANALAQSIHRPSDMVARYGGEEFVAILPHTDLDGARGIAERARTAVRALGLTNPKVPAGIVTVSVGVAVFDPARHLGAPEVIAEADRGLYAAKAAGRDCVRAAF